MKMPKINGKFAIADGCVAVSAVALPGAIAAFSPDGNPGSSDIDFNFLTPLFPADRNQRLIKSEEISLGSKPHTNVGPQRLPTKEFSQLASQLNMPIIASASQVGYQTSQVFTNNA